MLTKLPCRNALAALMITSVIGYGMLPAGFAVPITDSSGKVIEIFSNDGLSARHAVPPQTSDVLIGVRNGAMMSRGFLLASPEAVANMRATIARLNAVPLKNKKANFALSLAVLDAMSAASTADAHRALASLPIRVVHTVGTETVTTAVYVRGKVKFRVTSPMPAALPEDELPAASLRQEGRDMPSAGDDSGASSWDAPRRILQSGCQDNPDDPCATQQDIDDALASDAALQSDLDDMSADFSADESACYADGWCAEHRNETPGPNGVAGKCLGAYLGAAAGILWAGSGIVGAIAVTVSPEPVSKLLIWAAYVNAAAGVTAAAAGIVMAYQCHYYNQIAAIWTELQTDRAYCRLKAVAA